LGAGFYPVDINDNGLVVGWRDGTGYAWTGRNGLIQIPALSGDSSVFPMAVNNNGIVVGGSSNPANWPLTNRPFSWSMAGGTQLLPGDPRPGGSTTAVDINDHNQFVAASFYPFFGTSTRYSMQGYFWSQSRGMQVIGQGAETDWLESRVPLRLNNRRDIVGFGCYPRCDSRDSYYRHTLGASLRLNVDGDAELQPVANDVRSPRFVDINNAGTAVGGFTTDGMFGWEALSVSRDGTPRRLGHLLDGIPDAQRVHISSFAYAVNDEGAILGRARTDDPFPYEFVFLVDGDRVVDLSGILEREGWSLGIEYLSDAPWDIFTAGINSNGQIIVLGYRADGLHGLLLTPVPEPSCAYLLIFGMLAMLLRTRIRSNAAHQSRYSLWTNVCNRVGLVLLDFSAHPRSQRVLPA